MPKETLAPVQWQKRRPRKDKSAASDREICPRCGRPSAMIIGRSESIPVLYLRCEECRLTSIAPA